MKFILGRKISMSQIFQDDKVVPVTEIQAGPCLVKQIKTKDKDKYEAVQISFDQYLREFKSFDSNLKVGDKIKVDIFQPGDKVKISGTSKGKGFQGVVRRHGFHGSPASHGHKDQLRMPGSSGATGPARVFKGKKMPGRMGGKRISVGNLEVVEVMPDKNLLLIKGAVPGSRNSLLEISSI